MKWVPAMILAFAAAAVQAQQPPTAASEAAQAAAKGAAAVAKAPDAWQVTLSLGASANDGNSDAKQGNGGLLVEKKEKSNEYRLTVDGNYGEAEGDKNTDNLKADANYRRIFAERAYGYADASYAYDTIADVDYRYSAGPGLGYYLLKGEKTTLSFEAGPSYVWEKLGGVEDDYLGVRFAERCERKLPGNAKIWQSAEYVAEAQDFDNHLVTAELGAEAPLVGRLHLRVVVKDVYDNTPAPDRKENDFSVIGGLGVKF